MAHIYNETYPNVTVPLALDLHPHYSASFYCFATLSPPQLERALGPNSFIIITTYCCWQYMYLLYTSTHFHDMIECHQKTLFTLPFLWAITRYIIIFLYLSNMMIVLFTYNTYHIHCNGWENTTRLGCCAVQTQTHLFSPPLNTFDPVYTQVFCL